MRTDLTSGAWIEHVPVQALTFGHKRAVQRATRLAIPAGAIDEDLNVNRAAMLDGMDIMGMAAARQDATWALLITAWSYEVPVPELDKATGIVTGAAALDEIPLEDAEEIEQLLAPAAAKLARQPSGKGGTTSSSNGSSPGSRSGSRRG